MGSRLADAVSISCLALAAAALTASTATATILSGEVTGGTVVARAMFIRLVPPLANPRGNANSVGDNNYNEPHLYGFDEKQNVVLPAPLQVDVGATETLPAGTIVASHYIFFDPASSNTIEGTVTFDSDVLALITSSARLAASDELLGVEVNYLEKQQRGFEGGFDQASFSARQVTLKLSAGSPGDYFRVLTAAAPSGDYDRNGFVDGADVLLWQQALSSTVAPTGSGADGDKSGLVDAADLVVWRQDFGATVHVPADAAPAISAVPEPRTPMAALVTALAFRRRPGRVS